MNKYEKLTEDLKTALEAGRQAERLWRQGNNDGGTCNFDCPKLKLPRWVEDKVKESARKAGTSCFKYSLYGSASFIFNPDTNAQGDARTINAEAMCKALEDMGYDAYMYYAMD